MDKEYKKKQLLKKHNILERDFNLIFIKVD